MLARVEVLINLWTFGVPVVLMVWAVLRLAPKVPARGRYLIAVAGFVAALVLPIAAPALVHVTPAPPIRFDAPAVAADVVDPIATPVSLAWLFVAALLLVRDAVGHARLRTTRRALSDASVALKRDLAWPESTPLVVSEHAAPFTVGLVRPAVVLPVDLADRFPADVVRRIAAHELSHARWRDPLVFALLRAIAAIFWVSPAWLVLRWVRREREAAADAAALRGTNGEEETYVAALVRLSRLRPSRELAPAMAASDLEYRARRILAPPRVSIVAVLVFGAGATMLAFAAPAQLDSDEPIVIRSRVVLTSRPEPVVSVKVKPHETPWPKTASKPHRVRSPLGAAIDRRVDEVIEQALPPVSRELSSLSPPAEASPAADTHVDVDRHVDADRHIDIDQHADVDRHVARPAAPREDKPIRIVFRFKT